MFRDNLWLFCLLTHGSKKCYNGMLPGILPGHSRARAVQNPHAIGEGFRERRCEKRSCWSTEGELNSRPTQYQCVVLPTELSVHLEGVGFHPLDYIYIISHLFLIVNTIFNTFIKNFFAFKWCIIIIIVGVSKGVNSVKHFFVTFKSHFRKFVVCTNLGILHF